MADIGKVSIRRGDVELVSLSISSVTVNEGRLMMQLKGGYMDVSYLKRNNLYRLVFTDIQGLESVDALYETYTFNAGLNNYIDPSGNRISEPAVYNNQLQFMIVG